MAIFLLSASVAFAEGQATNTKEGNNFENYRAIAASTTARMQAVRADMQTRMETLRGKAMERMADIKDKVKQEMAKNLAVQFDNLNSTWTDKFMNQLDRYDAILQKIQDRAAVVGSDGKDIASTTLVTQLARTAILNVRTEIVAQAAKIYSLDPSIIPSTATSTPSGQEKIMKSLRASFQVLHSTLFKDLFALRDGLMKDARKAVQDALQALNQISN